MERKREAVYMLVTPDRYELPILITDSAVDLAKAAGVSISCVSHMIRKRERGTLKTRSRYVRVWLDEENEEDM